MFRKMLMAKQELPEEEARAILENGEIGILGVNGDDGYPYAVPLNYVYADGKIYFHCAKAGYKLDAIRRADKVCFTVIGRADIMREKLDTYYTSAMIFGRARILEDEAEIRQAVTTLGNKFCDDPRAVEAEINDTWNALCSVEITIEHITGRQAEDLIK
ncbi:MAG: pyridoxamine 5'-phosphate oxidase family protein [Anaerovoracaceae bacterium]|jgi:nitroimidazol reductase NimA-like FMN-containing flavoprotein (pyridoxamine 5'-phosphate oxidase superfamily)